MLKNLSVVISREEAGNRLDQWVRRRFPTVSRATVLDAVERRAIEVNGRPARKGYKLRVGDTVFIAEIAEQLDVKVIPNADIPLHVIHEDSELLVIDKPANLPVHPISFRETQTLANALVARYPDLARVGDQPLMPALVHRIDTDSSGLILAAKTPEAYHALRAQFRQQTVRKVYLAVVSGQVGQSGTIESYLAHRGGRIHRMVPVYNSQLAGRRRAMRAVTDYQLLIARERLSLLRVIIHTGVTHQIRCQMALLGHPILGDRLYGPAEKAEAAERLFLHAAEITLVHPKRNETLCFHSVPPPEFVRLFPEILGRTRKGDLP